MTRIMHRRGVFAPISVMFLVVFVIIGIVIHWASSSDYSQSALTIYGLKARMVCHAAQEEAQARIPEILGHARGAPSGGASPIPSKRQELFEAVKRELAPANPGSAEDTLKDGPTGTVLTVDLNETTLPKTFEIARNAAVTVPKARIRFHGFRPMVYHPDRRYEKPSTYYQDGLLDKGRTGSDIDFDKFRSYDFVGYYTIEVEAKSKAGKITRKVAAVHDVKIVNVSPPAREHVFYQGMALNPETFGNHLKNNLNNRDEGGAEKGWAALRIFGRGWGRILMRAMYVLDSVGFPRGLGGWAPTEGDGGEVEKPLISNSYIAPAVHQEGLVNTPNQDKKWYGWSIVPAPRGIMNDSQDVISFLVGKIGKGDSDWYKGPMRPVHTAGIRATDAPPEGEQPGFWERAWGYVTSTVTTLVDQGTRALGLDLLIPRLDVGNSLSETMDYCAEAEAPSDARKRDFCLFGNPRKIDVEDPTGTGGGTGNPLQGRAGLNGFSAFRGKKFSIDQDAGKENEAVMDLREPGGIELDGTEPPFVTEGTSLFPTWHWVPEAFILVRHKLFHFAAGFNYQVTEKQPSSEGGSGDQQVWQTPFALHWEGKRTPGWKDILLRYGVSVLTVALPGAGFLAGRAGVALFQATAARALFYSLGAAGAAYSTLGHWLFASTTHASLPNIQDFFKHDAQVNFALDPDDTNIVKHSLPVNYKPWTMAAVRRYDRLIRMSSQQSGTDQKVMDLDGVVWVDALYMHQGFRYRGKGVLVSGALPAGTTSRPEGPRQITRGILPEGGRQWDGGRENDPRDYLTIICLAQDEPNAAKTGDDYLMIKGDGQVGVIDASIVSGQGVALGPNAGNTLLFGNLVVGLVNKHRMPEENLWLHAYYNSECLGPLNDQQRQQNQVRDFNTGAWHQVSGSPRLAGYFDDWSETPEPGG